MMIVKLVSMQNQPLMSNPWKDWNVPYMLQTFNHTWSLENLWTLCEKFGIVAYIYIERKLSKQGKSLSLVHFF